MSIFLLLTLITS